MAKATIEVSADTRDALKKLKKDLSLKNMDEVINHLIDPPSASGEEAASSSSEDSGGEAPQKKRKKNVREPLFSFEQLADRHEMLEYYTGFDESAIRLLIERLVGVGKPFFFSFFFSLFPLLPQALFFVLLSLCLFLGECT
jgi:hypothetical protein